MRNSTLLLLLAVAILAATSIVSWRGWQQERARAMSLAARIVLEERRQATATQNSNPAPEKLIAQDSPQPTDPQPQADAYVYDEVRLFQNESYREAWRRYRELELTEGFVDVARVMGLSKESANRLIALLVDRELRYASQPHPNPRNEKELNARKLENERSQAEENAEVAAIVGEINLTKWHDYQASLPFRHQIREFRVELADGANALREDQVEPLVQVIYAERKRASEELLQFTEGLPWSGGMEGKSHRYRDARQLELDLAADERIHAAASRVLTANQLEALMIKLQRDRAAENARMEARNAMFEAARQ